MKKQFELQGKIFAHDDPPTDIPHIIKYMGSKKQIIDFITSHINEIHVKGKWVCDLFSGSCSVSASLRRQYDFFSNDIQAYSEIIAHTYFSDLSSYDFDEIMEIIDNTAQINML